MTRFGLATRPLEEPARRSPGPAGYETGRMYATRPSTPLWGAGTGRRIDIDNKFAHTKTDVYGHRKRLETPVSGGEGRGRSIVAPSALHRSPTHPRPDARPPRELARPPVRLSSPVIGDDALRVVVAVAPAPRQDAWAGGLRGGWCSDGSSEAPSSHMLTLAYPCAD